MRAEHFHAFVVAALLSRVLRVRRNGAQERAYYERIFPRVGNLRRVRFQSLEKTATVRKAGDADRIQGSPLVRALREDGLTAGLLGFGFRASDLAS